MASDVHIHPELLRTNLELIARQVVEGFIIGLHKSPFHGFSVEFAEHRIYNPGDPLRHIDWRVFGRTERLFVKRFEEETNLRCCLLVDTSASMYFPDDPDRISKLQFSALCAASLVQLLKRQLDAASLGLFDDDLYYLSDCRSTHAHSRMLMGRLQQLAASAPAGKATNAVRAIHQVAEQMHKRSLVVILSDMLDDPDRLESLTAALQHLRYNKHEVILFHVQDARRELDFEFENRPYEFVDLESGERVKLQASAVREEYKRRIAGFRKEIEHIAHQNRIDYIPVDLSKPADQVLQAFLLKRNRIL